MKRVSGPNNSVSQIFRIAPTWQSKIFSEIEGGEASVPLFFVRGPQKQILGYSDPL